MHIYILLHTSQPRYQNLERIYEAMFHNMHIEWYPHEGVSSLTQSWGLCGQMILRAKSAVAQLLVGSPMPDR